MIKLIATDIDDTLLPCAFPVISEQIAEMIREVRKRDILFVVASGRQYQGLVKTFAAAKEDLIYIAENGAQIQAPGRQTQYEIMPQEDFRGIVKDYRKFRSQGEFLIAAKDGAYLENPSPFFENLVKNGMNYEYRVVNDVLEENLDVLKISFYAPDGVRDLAYKTLIPKWKGRLNIMMGGAKWLPAVAQNADKGIALKMLLKDYHIAPQEAMVFGDGGNDIGMFRAAAESYAVEDASHELKAIAKYICPSAAKNGVCQTIVEKVLKQVSTDCEG
ncbi:MAG TPA: HAD family hydrolase [Desulfosporosinus sp.]|nr:HAD family hydrolase [Desulfosporosinus sp.]